MGEDFGLKTNVFMMLSCRGVCAYTAHEHIMKLTEEFRQNADEWRQIGKIAATDEHRRRIAEIANTWLAWAERRERMLRAGNLKVRRTSGKRSTTLAGQTELVERDRLT